MPLACTTVISSETFDNIYDFKQAGFPHKHHVIRCWSYQSTTNARFMKSPKPKGTKECHIHMCARRGATVGKRLT